METLKETLIKKSFKEPFKEPFIEALKGAVLGLSRFGCRAFWSLGVGCKVLLMVPCQSTKTIPWSSLLCLSQLGPTAS